MEVELVKLLTGVGLDANTVILGVLYLSIRERVSKLEWQRQQCCGE